MTCKTCKGVGYLRTAPSTCSAGGDQVKCPVCTPPAAPPVDAVPGNHGDVKRVVSALREIMVYVNRGHIEGDCSFCVDALEEGEQALGAYQASPTAPEATAQAGEIATVEIIETRPATWPWDDAETPPIWRVLVGEHCADFEFEQAARDFAGAINGATAQAGASDMREAFIAVVSLRRQEQRIDSVDKLLRLINGGASLASIRRSLPLTPAVGETRK